MAALSKYYSEILKTNNVTCAQILHPNTSCTHFLLENLPITLFRVGQFFVPLYFVSGFDHFHFFAGVSKKWMIFDLQLPLLANTKTLTKEKVKETVKTFVRSVIAGGSTVYIAYLTICLLS